MGELQDSFPVSVHLIADAGQGKLLQQVADSALAWVHPELQFFRVSDRASSPQSRSATRRHRAEDHNAAPPSPPWPSSCSCRSRGAAGRQLWGGVYGDAAPRAAPRAAPPPLPLPPRREGERRRRERERRPCAAGGAVPVQPGLLHAVQPGLLAPGTPMWAVRQVHYGKEIMRFVVYANPDTEIQLSLKRLPRGQTPAPTHSAVVEIRVRDVGSLVPLLPQPCSPISHVRWQTEDYDGNKILQRKRQQEAKGGGGGGGGEGQKNQEKE
ncbi:hypothetical protein CRUP_017792 [Coryphaenoides rupestris]|nr:hypothetical protein CRUP_017792 [Coryphaenoides rupestris]